MALTHYSSSKKMGLLISIPAVRKRIKSENTHRTSIRTIRSIALMIQKIVQHVIIQSDRIAAKEQAKRILPTHILSAVYSDADLRAFLLGASFRPDDAAPSASQLLNQTLRRLQTPKEIIAF